MPKIRHKFSDVLHENAGKYLPEGITLAYLIREPYDVSKAKMLAKLSTDGGFCYSVEIMVDTLKMPQSLRNAIYKQRRALALKRLKGQL